jgi:hypothetical protein
MYPTWILVLLLVKGASGGDAVTAVEFLNEEHCRRALVAIGKQFDEDKRPLGATLVAVCVEK